MDECVSLACGVMEYIKGDWLKPGCAVIDVGINAKAEGGQAKTVLRKLKIVSPLLSFAFNSTFDPSTPPCPISNPYISSKFLPDAPATNTA